MTSIIKPAYIPWVLQLAAQVEYLENLPTLFVPSEHIWRRCTCQFVLHWSVCGTSALVVQIGSCNIDCPTSGETSCILVLTSIIVVWSSKVAFVFSALLRWKYANPSFTMNLICWFQVDDHSGVLLHIYHRTKLLYHKVVHCIVHLCLRSELFSLILWAGLACGNVCKCFFLPDFVCDLQRFSFVPLNSHL